MVPRKPQTSAVASGPPKAVQGGVHLRPQPELAAASPSSSDTDSLFPVLLLGLYLLLSTSFASELLVVYAGVKLHIVGAVGLATLAVGLLQGHLRRFLSTPLARPWFLLFGWYLLASVFGLYPRGSLAFILEYGLRFHIIPIFFCAVARSTKSVRRLIYMTGLGFLVILFFTWRVGELADGRLVLPETSMGNPNDLALHLLLGWSFLFMMAWTPSLPFRLLWGIITPALLYFVMKTGSRANFLTLLLLGACVFLAVKWPVRIALALALLVAIPVMSPLIPQDALERIKAMPWLLEDEAPPDKELLQRAVESSQARRALQERAVELTFQNPLLGVGPLMFADAVDIQVREKEGRKSTWQSQHNAYLQVSSETGIPGLIFYVWSLVLCLRWNYRSFRETRERRDLRVVAGQSFCLLLATVVYAFGTMFCNIAYFYYFSFLVGFSAANRLALLREQGDGDKPNLTPAQL